MKIKHSILLILFTALCVMHAFATHQRAAEITYKHISGLTYEAKIITYTYTYPLSLADRPTLEIWWGDGSSSTLIRTDSVRMPGDITQNIYEYNPDKLAFTNRHTYSSPGTYTLYMEDPNRNYGVVNIPYSVNVPMYVETQLVINPFLGYNNSPVLLNLPVDLGCVNRTFVHNPGAYDIDGDSLSYRLVNCKTTGGIDIPGFTQPAASNSFTMDPVTGDVVWDAPIMQGEYNIAFIVEEWRNGVRIGYVTRDMQIEILACDNTPPVIVSVDDTCVTAGESITFDVIAYDPDGDYVTLTATGGPFELNEMPASIDPNPAAGDDTVSTSFAWTTTCASVQKQPFQLFFKAEDDDSPISLVSYKTILVTVVSPAPENLTAMAVGSTIRLSWDSAACAKTAGYKIYRRSGPSGFIPEVCQTGVPASTGYVLIHENDGIGSITYTDDNNGMGLIHGIEYCYIVTAFFLDGAESYASLEACATLKRDIPVITNVSNDSADLQLGRAFIAWSKPVDLDTVQIPGPYQYVIQRSEGDAGANLQNIATLDGLDDTTYFDNAINLNTSNMAYSYRIALESLSFGFIGNSQLASSIFLDVYETDEQVDLSFQPNVPWNNEYYVVYRRNPGAEQFDSIALVNSAFYSDTGLVNGEEYCYYVKSVGGYTAEGFIDPIINFSQLVCAVPEDNRPPCVPVLSVETNCDLAINTLYWGNPPDTVCDTDVAGYEIFYSPLEGADFTLLVSLGASGSASYEHFNNGSITGCYAVVAIDSTGNASEYSNIACINNDTCSVYHLPNVFTPNDDLYNDIYHPFPYTSVERVDMTIFNRWGNIVYETEDPDINWDGKDYKTNMKCSDGVYFYVCKVYEITLYGVLPRELRGSITILTD